MPVTVVFGGSGFIGSHLVADLLNKGRQVVVADVVRPASLAPGAGFWECDVRQPLDRDLEAEIVYNLAAVHRTPGHPDHEYYDTNVGGALNITAWAVQTAVRRLCFTSSISVYGPTETPKDETSPLRPTSAYGRSKLLAEQIHREWASSDSNRRLAVVRPAVVFGPGEHGNFTRLAAALRRRRFVYPGRRDTLKACGYVSDLIRALQESVDLANPIFTCNYCYPVVSSIEQICDTFQRVAGYPAPPALPAPVMQAALAVLSALPATPLDANRVRKLVASTNIVPKALVDEGFRWETDLASGLRRWRDADPRGHFV